MDKLTLAVLAGQNEVVEYELPEGIRAPDGHLSRAHASCLDVASTRWNGLTFDRMIGSATHVQPRPRTGTCRWCRRPFDLRPHAQLAKHPKPARMSKVVGSQNMSAQYHNDKWFENMVKAMKNEPPWNPAKSAVGRVMGKHPALFHHYSTFQRTHLQHTYRKE